MILSSPSVPALRAFAVPQPGLDAMIAAAQVDLGVLLAVAVFAVGAVATAFAIKSRRKDDAISVQDRLIAAYKQEAELERIARNAAEARAEELRAEWFERLAVKIAAAVGQAVREEIRRENGHA